MSKKSNLYFDLRSYIKEAGLTNREFISGFLGNSEEITSAVSTLVSGYVKVRSISRKVLKVDDKYKGQKTISFTPFEPLTQDMGVVLVSENPNMPDPTVSYLDTVPQMVNAVYLKTEKRILSKYNIMDDPQYLDNHLKILANALVIKEDMLLFNMFKTFAQMKQPYGTKINNTNIDRDNVSLDNFNTALKQLIGEIGAIQGKQLGYNLTTRFLIAHSSYRMSIMETLPVYTPEDIAREILVSGNLETYYGLISLIHQVNDYMKYIFATSYPELVGVFWEARQVDVIKVDLGDKIELQLVEQIGMFVYNPYAFTYMKIA